MWPRLFTIGGFTQHTYGLLVATAFFAAVMLARRLARREGLPGELVFNLAVYMALAGLAGAKILLVISDWGYYSANPRRILSLQALQAGGVFYGGFLAAIVFAVWYARRAGLPFLKTADVFVPGVALGHAIGRLGCFAAGCCWGKPTGGGWGVTFRDPYTHDMFGTPLGIPLHPTQLYEAAAEGVICAFLLWAYKRKTFDGQILSFYLALYGSARFVIEFFRADPDRGFVFAGALSTSQFIALLMLALSGGIWFRRRHVRIASSPARG